MMPELPQSFADDARLVRERMLLDLTDRGARMLDATVRSLRAGTGRFAFRDGLVGLGEGLREVLCSWGVPDRCIFTNDTPVAGYFVERKFWDFAVRDAEGRELAIIEFIRVRRSSQAAAGAGFARVFHQLLGMLYDASFNGRRAFTGAIVVRESPTGPRRGPSARRLLRLDRFDRTARAAGLLDALACIETSGGRAVDVSAELGLVRFVSVLHRRLRAVPSDAWPPRLWRPPEAYCLRAANRV